MLNKNRIAALEQIAAPEHKVFIKWDNETKVPKNLKNTQVITIEWI